MEARAHAGPRIELQRGDDRVVMPIVLRETLIGRIDSNHLILDDASISRIHARMLLSDRKVEIEDCGSTLGTQVNGELIDRATLKHGDVVKLGAVSFRLSAGLTSSSNDVRTVLDRLSARAINPTSRIKSRLTLRRMLERYSTV